MRNSNGRFNLCFGHCSAGHLQSGTGVRVRPDLDRRRVVARIGSTGMTSSLSTGAYSTQMPARAKAPMTFQSIAAAQSDSNILRMFELCVLNPLRADMRSKLRFCTPNVRRSRSCVCSLLRAGKNCGIMPEELNCSWKWSIRFQIGFVARAEKNISSPDRSIICVLANPDSWYIISTFFGGTPMDHSLG